MRRVALALAAAAALAGCQSDESSMLPLKKGNKWRYQVTLDFESRVTELEAKSAAPVDGKDGWLLTSDMGRSLLGWDKGRLYAEEMGGTHFDPAIPIFGHPEKNSKILWKGAVTLGGRRIPAQATLEDQDAKMTLGARDYGTVLTTLTIKSAGHMDEILTWYARDIGILRQEQRRDGALHRKLVYLSGP